ncbi:hypothetical protein [Bradyrhizobium cenepequi]
MLKRLLLAFTFAQLAGAFLTPAHAVDAPPAGPLTIAKQGSFFVGGREVKSDALSTIPNFGAAGMITVDQMYVRYQTPLQPRDYSITPIHGCCLTGKSWETRPDGRTGWDAEKGRRLFPHQVEMRERRDDRYATTATDHDNLSVAATPTAAYPGFQATRGPSGCCENP